MLPPALLSGSSASRCALGGEISQTVLENVCSGQAGPWEWVQVPAEEGDCDTPAENLLVPELSARGVLLSTPSPLELGQTGGCELGRGSFGL